MAFALNLVLFSSIFMLALLVRQSAGDDGDEVTEEYCRVLDDTVARCTQPAIMFPDDTPWCPYYSCSAFGAAPPCGAPDKKARTSAR